MHVWIFVLQIQEYWKPMKNLQRAEAVWSHWYEWSDTHCMHGPNCSRRKEGILCKWGGRHSEVQMISGAVLPLWKVRLPAWLLDLGHSLWSLACVGDLGCFYHAGGVTSGYTVLPLWKVRGPPWLLA